VVKVCSKHSDPSVLKLLEEFGAILEMPLSLVDPQLIGFTYVIGRSTAI
jgi:hypothetical protein